MVKVRTQNSIGVEHSRHYRAISHPIHTWLQRRRCVLLNTHPLESCCKLPWRSTMILCLLALLASMVVSCHQLLLQWHRRALPQTLGLWATTLAAHGCREQHLVACTPLQHGTRWPSHGCSRSKTSHSAREKSWLSLAELQCSSGSALMLGSIVCRLVGHHCITSR